jgi:UDP-2,3-diacylglucosamine hydrolase
VHNLTSTKAQPEWLALFISDLHLQASMPKTAQVFLEFLQTQATNAQQLYLLGDLFEYWAGDDDLSSPFPQQIESAIRELSDKGVAVFWISGNRDFLVGEEFAQRAGLTLLPDPYVATIGGHKLILAHGDAQCTDDTAYMAFRKQVRQPEWQRNFLAMPLAQRKAIIEGARNDSREAQRTKSYDIMDVNADAIDTLFKQHDASLLIHGHTHRPARHTYGESGNVRYVLPDWDCDALPPRGGWIGINADGEIKCFNLDGSEVQ